MGEAKRRQKANDPTWGKGDNNWQLRMRCLTAEAKKVRVIVEHPIARMQRAIEARKAAKAAKNATTA